MKDPFESYKLYNSLKLHFETDNYDAIKYNFKTSVKPTSFFKRKDKYFFAKLANTYDNLLDFYVANFKHDVKYVGDMLNEHGERYYREHKKVCESITYTFENDINKLYESNSDFDALLEAKDNEHPFVITYWLQDEIHLETVVILDSITGFVDRENKKISETIIWPDIFRKITKYKPFVKFDKTKCVNILKKTFT